jgi:lysozyme family protein
MRHNFDASLAALLKHEGGFVNHPADPGGMTNLGVTKAVWEAWVKRPVDEKSMRALTPATVSPLYKMKYWDKVNGDELPTGLDYVVFDAAVNSGPSRAIKWLQECLGVTADGVIGSNTMIAMHSKSVDDIVAAYQAKRLAFLKALPTWGVFGKGWERRVAEVTSQTFA